jgi:hypothetical protein
MFAAIKAGKPKAVLGTIVQTKASAIRNTGHGQDTGYARRGSEERLLGYRLNPSVEVASFSC